MYKQALIVLLIVLSSSYAKSQSAPLPQISVKENAFVTPDGAPVIFRGLNTSDPDRLQREGHWNAEYFDEMKKWGANIVRFPVHPTAWRKHGESKYIALLDQGVRWATERKMYVIIDWHSIGNLKTEKYQDKMYHTTMDETKRFWEVMAKHFKDNSTVAFFELFNEPTTQNGKLGSISWKEWKGMMEELIDIIRRSGAKAVPLVAGFNWAYDLSEVREDPVNAQGIGYVSHPYPQKREKPWEEKWTADWGYVAEKYPLILTEIGFCGADDRGAHIPVISDESYGESITKYTEERGISWVVWVFDPQWSPMMFYDWSFSPTRQGKFFKKVLQEQGLIND